MTDPLCVLQEVTAALLRLTEAPGGMDRYRAALRSPVRGYWSGTIGESQFVVAFTLAIERFLTMAWNEGAALAGLAPGDLSDDEVVARDQAIAEEQGLIGKFLSEIATKGKASGGKLQPLYDRIELWVNRYKDIHNRALQMAKTDPKLRWDLGKTEDHCVDCLRYNQRVYRASTWRKYGIQPQSRKLACHGYHCDCRFTVAPGAVLSKGRPPAMTGG